MSSGALALSTASIMPATGARCDLPRALTPSCVNSALPRSKGPGKAESKISTAGHYALVVDEIVGDARGIGPQENTKSRDPVGPARFFSLSRFSRS
jgi:hypothetical protein